MRRPLRIICSWIIALSIILLSANSATALPSPELQPEDVSPPQIVDLQYRDLLGRAPDASGLGYWSGRVSSGTAIADVVNSMIDSKEAGGAYRPVIRLYRSVFLRPPDYRGLMYWVKVMRTGSSMKKVANWFVASSEFQRRYGALDDDAFIDQIYRNVLGRRADPGGKAFWLGKMNSGMTRGEVVLGFSESGENIARTRVSNTMSLLTATMLRRVANPEEVAAWDAGPQTLTTRLLVERVLNDPEYQRRLASLFPEQHPLTGQATNAAAARPAVALKIDNVDQARPQTGIGRADVVYEEMVEGSLTRLIAIFHSQLPPTAGPVRSVRVSDFDVLAAYNRPLLGASGANPGVLSALKDAPVVNVNALVSPHYWRDTSRRAPHNLYTSPSKLLSHAPSGAAAPPAMFLTGHRDAGASVKGVTVAFGRATANWTWDATQAQWRRKQNGTDHVDKTGGPIGAENVVVMVTSYTPNAIDANSPEAHTVGTGRAMMFLNGTVVDGTWKRTEATAPIKFYDKSGRQVVFRPGQTWVELAPPGTITIHPA